MEPTRSIENAEWLTIDRRASDMPQYGRLGGRPAAGLNPADLTDPPGASTDRRTTPLPTTGSVQTGAWRSAMAPRRRGVAAR
jgi:hypothetical protein